VSATSATLKYWEYENKPSSDKFLGRTIGSVQRHITTNEYLDISKKKFIGHIHKLEELAKKQELLPEIAENPSPKALTLAKFVFEQLQKDELSPSKTVASAEGGVAFCFVAGDKYADIECLNSGEILGVTTNRRDRPSVWEIQLNQSEVARATERIRQFINEY